MYFLHVRKGASRGWEVPIFEVPEVRPLASGEDHGGTGVGCEKIRGELVDKLGGLRILARIAVRGDLFVFLIQVSLN
jgi:hypothetical protein